MNSSIILPAGSTVSDLQTHIGAPVDIWDGKNLVNGFNEVLGNALDDDHMLSNNTTYYTYTYGQTKEAFVSRGTVITLELNDAEAPTLTLSLTNKDAANNAYEITIIASEEITNLSD